MAVTRTRLFMLMMWKNFKLLASKPASTFFRVVLPLVLALLLVVAKYHKPKAHHQATFPSYCAIQNHPQWCTINTTVFNYKYKPPTVLDMLDFKKNRVVYCPADHPLINKAMKAMEKYFLEVLSFKNCDAFQEEVSQKVINDGSSVMAGLEFHISESRQVQAGENQVPDHIDLKLRFPSLLAHYDKETRLWMTDKRSIQSKDILPGPRTKGLKVGEYTRQGFVTIMGLATYELIRAINASFTFPEVHLKRFPYPSWTNETKRWLIHMLLVLMTGFAYFVQYVSVVRSFLKEKETHLRMAMRVMGVPHHLHWTTKFATGYLFAALLSPATSSILGLRWFPVKDIVSANQTRTVYKTLMMETSPAVIYVFLMAYGAAVITFAFAVATLFTSSIRGQIVSSLVYVLSFMPFVLFTVSEEDTPVYKQLMSCVCVNSAMGLGWSAMLHWEYVGVGASFENFWSTSHGKNCPLGYVVLMLVFDTVLHMVFTTYFIGVFPEDGSPAKSVYFLFTKKFWCPDRVPLERSRSMSVSRPRWEIIRSHNEPERLVSVDIINLRKIYGGNIVAVKDLSMRIYEGRVTVIIGQKDAGKSTIIRMLAGITPPTSGTATIYGHDLHSDFNKVRHKLGFCSHNNVMYESLSIEDNLKFFAMLRGASRTEARQDTDYYIKLLELSGERKKSPKRLSPEVRRKLSMALAFCGDAKLVLLEEPTFGLKFAGKRAVWDLINLLKRHRTVIVNTLFIDEAEALGDNIAIVAAGEVLCYGSLPSLKSKYGVGYFLHVRVTPKVDLVNLNRMMRFYIPRLDDPEVLLNDDGEVTELHYTLSKSDSSKFSGMLADLEGVNGHVLGVKGFSVNVVSFGEVFLKIITQQHHKTKPQDEITEHQWRLWRSRILHRKPLLLTRGCRLILNHVLAMFMKRILILARNKMSFVFMVMTIVFILWFAMSEVVSHRPFTVLPSLELVSGSDVILLETHKDPLLVNDDVVRKITDGAKLFLPFRMVDSVFDTIVEERAENNLKFNDQGIANAITFEATPDDKSVLISWYTEDVYHAEGEAAAKSFALIYHAATGRSINIANHPFFFEIRTEHDSSPVTRYLQVTVLLSLIMSLVSAYFSMFYVMESCNDHKNFQLISGVTVWVFLLVRFVCDYAIYLFMTLILILLLAVFKKEGFNTIQNLYDIFLLLLGFGFVSIPLMHMVSKAYRYPKSAVLKLTTFNFMTGIAMFGTIWAFADLGMQNLNTTRGIFMFWPFYAITDAFQVYQKLSAKHRTCDAVLATCRQQPPDYSTACLRKYCNNSRLLGFTCCSSSDTEAEFFSMDQLGQHLTHFFASGLGVFVLVFLWEYRLLRTVTWNLAAICTRTRPVPEQDEDKHVLNERIKISKYPESGADYPLVLKNLTRSFGETKAVNGLCVGVHRGECFGLFGPNGAGKSTVFALITGATRIGYGSVYVLGEDIAQGASRLVSKHTGHCPQVDALLADLTVKETLVIHALIKGVRFSDTIRMASTLASDLQFKEQMNKKIKKLSRGNKRKVSVAMSLIGKPKIILLDEPTMGMDPKSKKVVWKVLAAVRDRGVSFLLTTHSMAECEALCSRLAIMIQGTFNAMGSMALLNEKFSKGYTVTVKLEDCDDLEDELEKMEDLEAYFESTFNNVILIERHQQKMTFFTEDQNMKCSTMFKELEKAKVDFPFKDYAIGQSKLEQVFLYFTRRQGA